jgi:hypothetical protein
MLMALLYVYTSRIDFISRVIFLFIQNDNYQDPTTQLNAGDRKLKFKCFSDQWHPGFIEKCFKNIVANGDSKFGIITGNLSNRKNVPQKM